MAYAPGPNGGQNYPPPPPQPQAVYYIPHGMPATAATSASSATSVDRLTVPFLLVVSAGAFVAWASWFGTTSINAIQQNIREISVTLNNYIERQDERVDRIETVLDRRTAERWTKQDQQLFCARTEAIPGNKGWKCGETENGRAMLETPSIFGGHFENTAPVADVEVPPIGRWSQPKVRATP